MTRMKKVRRFGKFMSAPEVYIQLDLFNGR